MLIIVCAFTIPFEVGHVPLFLCFTKPLEGSRLLLYEALDVLDP